MGKPRTVDPILPTSAHSSIIPSTPSSTPNAIIMVLESAVSNVASYDSSSSDDSYGVSERRYPPQPEVPSFFGFRFGIFTEEGKQRFINLQLNLAQREFNFHPTPIEKEGLSYYHALFYVAEAKGAIYGTVMGAAVGFLVTRRQKQVGFLYRGIGQRLRVPKRHQLLASKMTNFLFCTAVGRLWGITAWGVYAFNKINQMQQEDPNMQRYLKLRQQWLEERQRRARAGLPSQPVVSTVEEVRKLGDRFEDDQKDEQSLGGLEEGYDLIKPEDIGITTTGEEVVAARRASMEAAKKTREAAKAKPEDDDIFFGGDDEDKGRAASTATTTTAQPRKSQAGERRGESAWERLRRQALHGAESEEHKEDSFSFGNGDERAGNKSERSAWDSHVEGRRK
jgi:hypothetical protein